MDEGQTDDIRKHFRQSYRPAQPGNLNQNIGEIKDQPEDISNRATDIGDNHDSFINLELNEEQPKRKWWLFNRKSKSKKSVAKRIARSFAILMVALVLGIGSLLGYGVFKGSKYLSR